MRFVSDLVIKRSIKSALFVAVFAATISVLVRYDVISPGPSPSPSNPLEKIASAISTPPEPVGDIWPWRILWYLYPWQTLISALVAGTGAFFAGRQAYEGAMLPVKYAMKKEHRESRQTRIALLHALSTSSQVIIGEVQTAQIAIALAQERNYGRSAAISLVSLKLPAMFPYNWEDYKNISQKVTAASFSLAATLDGSMDSIRKYGENGLTDNDKITDGFVAAMLMQLQSIGSKALILKNEVTEELKNHP